MREHAANGVDPALKAAHARHLCRWTARVVPGPYQREQGRDDLPAMLGYPAFQIVLEAATRPRSVCMGIHTYPIAASGQIAAELDIVAGRHPGSPLGIDPVATLAQDTLLDRVRGERRVQACCLQSCLEVIDRDDRRPFREGGRDPLAPFVIVIRRGHHAGFATGRNERHGLRQ